ncbi:type I 3-dehydroquinate dehydratase [Furfurilactobacillus siliginis]|uniref:3-dehydroquinate dehydratase n=1 Tax=Furfurilactobacillus siliginis TaxID=348151 RepID=A0A0R2L9H6_9LACO|nr:type I 3-dehydroquinate dehydratase [Furfurilactobacillus siliginis]KRN95770.1 3-dehydroquinate dehydratase [Furfurilactobacillus siliginis]GEK28954.1 3-dehydroquinate dehydratase [Furfurilactobacillus siliginis]
MTKSLTVRQTTLSATTGLRLIVSLMIKNVDDVAPLATVWQRVKPDLLEWRIDQLADQSRHNVLVTGKALREQAGNIPIIATIRTATEGGPFAAGDASYQKIYTALLESHLIDFVDIEASQTPMNIKILLANAKAFNVATIISHHDFQKTPAEGEIIQQLADMASYQPAIVKAAYMPAQPTDVLTVLQATAKANTILAPQLLTMTMGDFGKMSRVIGDQFGSVASFVTMNDTQSAPGQLDIDIVRNLRMQLGLS